MAWYQGPIVSNAAGELLRVFDTYVILNSHWTCHDAEAAANCKVYRCQDAGENVDFYLRVDDNYAAYSILELYDDWDEPTHAATGFGSGAVYWTRTNSVSFFLSVHDHRVIYGNDRTENRLIRAYYAGELVRAEKTASRPILCGGNGSGIDYPALFSDPGDEYSRWYVLRSTEGNSAGVRPIGGQGVKTMFTSGSRFFLMPIYVVEYSASICSPVILGYLEGASGGRAGSLTAISWAYSPGLPVYADGSEWMMGCDDSWNMIGLIKKD